jgi:hypothetical protein
LREGRAENPPVEGVERPRTRGDCEDVVRPCPYVSCKYNLYLDVNPHTGSIKLNYPTSSLTSSSILRARRFRTRPDDARGAQPSKLNITRERCRQLETRGLFTLKANSRSAGLDAESIAASSIRRATTSRRCQRSATSRRSERALPTRNARAR